MNRGHIDTTRHGRSFLERHQRPAAADDNIKCSAHASLQTAGRPSPLGRVSDLVLHPLWPVGYGGEQTPRFKISTARSSSGKEHRPEGPGIVRRGFSY